MGNRKKSRAWVQAQKEAGRRPIKDRIDYEFMQQAIHKSYRQAAQKSKQKKQEKPNPFENPGLLAIEKSIVADPDDMHVRAVYADRCEELGLYERAEFIRLQLEILKVTDCAWHEGMPGLSKTKTVREIWADLDGRIRNIRPKGGWHIWLHHYAAYLQKHCCPLTWSGGFVESVTVQTFQDWLERHEQLPNMIPLKKVHIGVWFQQGDGVRLRNLMEADENAMTSFFKEQAAAGRIRNPVNPSETAEYWAAYWSGDPGPNMEYLLEFKWPRYQFSIINYSIQLENPRFQPGHWRSRIMNEWAQEFDPLEGVNPVDDITITGDSGEEPE